MPTVTEEEIQGYAHCGQPRCPGSQQEPVGAVRSETAFSYREGGGDMPGTEKSFVHLAFADEEDRACPHCGRAREVTDQRRKTYAKLSGFDPMGLLGVPEFNPAQQAELASAPMTDAERQAAVEREQELRGQLAAQQAQIDAILAAQAGPLEEPTE